MVAASSETEALQLERIRKKKKRGKVIVSVEDTLFVFLVVQTVITTMTFLPRIYRAADFFPQSIDSELHIQICYKLPLFFFF